MADGADFAPGVKEELEKLATEGVAAEQPVVAPAAPRFVGGSTRSQPYSLAFPVEYDGKLYDAIFLRRMTFSDTRDFVEHLRDLSEAERKDVNFPVFFHADGEPVPDVVLNALDADDRATLDQAVESFLPRRFRADPEPDSSSQNGGTTARS